MEGMAGGFAGRYVCGGDIPPHLAGCETALFATRTDARRVWKQKHSPEYWALKVVRVNVTVEVSKGKPTSCWTHRRSGRRDIMRWMRRVKLFPQRAPSPSSGA